jgi:hypothetical protein
MSISEDHGLEAMPKDALSMYSVGISTAGAAKRFPRESFGCELVYIFINSRMTI